MIVDQCPSLTYAENAIIACTLDKIGRISRILIIEQSLWTPTRATPTPRARSNGRVERFCLVHKLHFDEHYIIAKNSSSRDSVLAKLGQNNQCTVVDSMESPTVNFSQSLPALCDHGVNTGHSSLDLDLGTSMLLVSYSSTCVPRSQSSDRYQD
jgi:hypothetical protein